MIETFMKRNHEQFEELDPDHIAEFKPIFMIGPCKLEGETSVDRLPPPFVREQISRNSNPHHRTKSNNSEPLEKIDEEAEDTHNITPLNQTNSDLKVVQTPK